MVVLIDDTAMIDLGLSTINEPPFVDIDDGSSLTLKE